MRECEYIWEDMKGGRSERGNIDEFKR